MFSCTKEPVASLGAWLLPYVIRERKLGYFVMEIADEKAVLKTFLFITNDGTPEGEKLNKLCRLSRDAKTYLELDKLSAFLLTDIREDRQLVDIFNACGMGQLFTFVHEDARVHKEVVAPFIKKMLPLEDIAWQIQEPED